MRKRILCVVSIAAVVGIFVVGMAGPAETTSTFAPAGQGPRAASPVAPEADGTVESPADAGPTVVAGYVRESTPPHGTTGMRRMEWGEGIRTLAGHVGELDSREARAFLRVVATDEEVARDLAAIGAGLAASTDPAERVRGIALLSGLGRMTLDEWRAIVACEGDVDSRQAILSLAPAGPEGTAPVADALLERAVADPDASVRAAAIQALPGDLGPDRLASLLSIAGRDPEPAPRLAAIAYVQAARLTAPEVLRGLLDLARERTEVREVRRAAAFALIQMESDAPGLLAAVDASPEGLHHVLGETGRRQE